MHVWGAHGRICSLTACQLSCMTYFGRVAVPVVVFPVSPLGPLGIRSHVAARLQGEGSEGSE